MIEELESDAVTKTVTEPTVEERAALMGWKPKGELKDGKDFVGAAEFISRKPLFDKIHAQNEKLQNLELTLKETAQHVLKVQEIAYKKAVKELQSERKAAITQADVERVHEIDDELNQLVADQPVEPPPKEYLDWQKENPWFTSDDEMFSFACANFDAHVKRNPKANLMDTLEKVTKATKRAFPENFESVQPGKGGSKLEGAKPVADKPAGLTYGTLTESQKRVCDTMVRQNVMSREDYIKSLAEMA